MAGDVHSLTFTRLRCHLNKHQHRFSLDHFSFPPHPQQRQTFSAALATIAATTEIKSASTHLHLGVICLFHLGQIRHIKKYPMVEYNKTHLAKTKGKEVVAAATTVVVVFYVFHPILL